VVPAFGAPTMKKLGQVSMIFNFFSEIYKNLPDLRPNL